MIAGAEHVDRVGVGVELGQRRPVDEVDLVGALGGLEGGGVARIDADGASARSRRATRARASTQPAATARRRTS